MLLPNEAGQESAVHYYSLSSAQKSIWFDQALHPDLPLYNIGLLASFSGQIDISLLEKAVARVVRTHDALRMSVEVVDGVPMLLVCEDTSFKLETICFSRSENPGAAVNEFVAREFSLPFELSGRLWKLSLLQISATEYVLLTKFHHLICDGIGINLFGKAVADFYNELQSNQPKSQWPVSHSYLQFVEDQNAYARSHRYLKDRDFWLEKMRAAPAALLSRKQSSSDLQVHKSQQAYWTVPRELFRNIESFSAQQGLSSVHFLTAIMVAYFARVQDVDELVIGFPMHNRLSASQKQTIGMLVSMVPLFVKVDFSASFPVLMKSIAHEIKSGFRHQRFSIAELSRSLELAQNGKKRFYDISFSYESFPSDLCFGEAKLNVRPLHNGYEQVPLAIFVRDYHGEQGVSVAFDFNLAYFDKAEVENIIEAFTRITDHVLADLNAPIALLPILSANEKNSVLNEFNQEVAGYPTDKLLHELIEAQVAETPDATAIHFENLSLSYSSLNRISNRLAHKLVALGVKPDCRVGIYMRRSAEMVISLLAVLKAGGAYVPLDPALPRDRLAGMLRNCQPVMLLSNSETVSGVSDSTVFTLVVDQWIDSEEFSTISDENIDPVLLGLSATHLAYVIYTSGSTGSPKGVMNQHDGVVNRLWWAKKEYRLNEAEKILQKTPFNFDVSVWEFFLPLLSGASLIIAPPDSHQDPNWLRRIIEENSVTMLHFVPSMLSAFLSQFNAPQTSTSLRKVLCSGEALPYSLQQRFFQFFPQVELHNLYGPTEAAIDVTYWRCDEQSPLTFVPIGYSIDNVKLSILDRRLQPVPIGAVGEIYIGGIQVARGYLNQPELTAERFINNPFGNGTFERLYKTGDLGRWLADGAIEYLGRNDFQVKIRGVRVELGEIEAVIVQCEGVREAVVIAREDSATDKRLVAYIVAETGVMLDVNHLRNQIAQQLSDFMVPSAIILMDALPVTSNGKLDRKALPAPDRSALSLNYYEPPQGEIEHFLSIIWREILNVEKIGRHDNFFRLGGHSLTALQMLARLRERGRLELTLKDVFSTPTLAELALKVVSQNRTELSRIGKVDRKAPLILSWAQQRLWFLHQLDSSASAAYQMSVALNMVGNLNVDVLLKTLTKVMQRHESLRTCFYENQGKPYQRVLPGNICFPLSHQDLSRLNSKDQDEQVARHIESIANQCFDLEFGPLINGTLLKLSEQKHVLVLTQHHIISDGWSIGILVEEVSALYAAELENKQANLAPLPIQYADYAAWQRKFLTKEKLQEQIKYWREQLASAPELITLPVDRARPAIQSYAGGRCKVDVPPDLFLKLKALSQQHDVTLFMTLLCAWSVLLARLSNQRDVVIGVPVAGRQSTETEHLIGFFVNTLALRITYEPDLTVGMALSLIKNIALSGFANQEVPFEQVVDALGIKRSLNHSPVFQVMLAFNNATLVDGLKLPELTLSTLSLPYTTTHYDLTLLADETAEGLVVALEYSEDLFEKITVERIGEQLLNILNGLCVDALSLWQLPLVSKSELGKITTEFNAAETIYDGGMLLHKQFELHAKSNPNQVALVFNGERISYAQLNRRANKIAHGLLHLGVKPDDRVALFFPRSVNAVEAVLGVLKSGAAYVPIDVSYPHERIKFILDDADPKVVLTVTDYLQDGLFNQPVILLDEEIIYVDNGVMDLSILSDSNPASVTSRHNHLAYLIYTSGSTGQPKGVMVEHGGLISLFSAMRSEFEFSSNDTWTLFHSIAFDFSVWEMWGALAHGGRLVIVPQETTRSSEQLYQLLKSESVNILNHTPSEFRYLLSDYAGNRDPLAIRLLFLGAETVDIQNVLPWLRANNLSWNQVVNLYGPTETTICATYHRLKDTDTGVIPIGKPVPNCRIFILDEYNQPVPIGVSGEICIAGPQLARGYRNYSELTSAKFVAAPLADEAALRFYKTGDLGRWRGDGTIEYLGRNDFQVKIRGFRVELGEIETRILAYPGVKEVAVLAREDHHGEKKLVAYLTLDAGIRISAKDIRDDLSDSLADYMLPAAFVVLDEFPITANGKLDRAALPAPNKIAYQAKKYVKPESEIECLIAQVWQELLHVENVGLEDNFFELGGHSLLVVNMISQLKQKGYHLEVRNVFSHPTLVEMARRAVVTRQQDSDIPENKIPQESYIITPEMLPLVRLAQLDIDRLAREVVGGVGNIKDIYPLAPLQEGILFHHILEQKGDPYLLNSIMAFKQKSLMDGFLEALQQVIDRHDILRTSIHWQDLEQPLQIVWRHAKLTTTYLELDVGDKLTAFISYLDPANKRINLQQAPLMTAYATYDAINDEWLLGILNHHIVCDHVTLELIFEEITLILQGNSELLPVALPYRSFIARFKQISTFESESFFRKLLADVHEPTSAFGTGRTQATNAPVRKSELMLPDELCMSIREYARLWGVTPAVLFHVAWAKVLEEFSQSQDVVFGTVLSGRLQDIHASHRVLGMFINTLPVRIQFGEHSLAHTVQATYQLLSDLLQHEQTPLSSVQRYSQIPASLPLITSLLNYRHTNAKNAGKDLMPGIQLLAMEERTNYPISVSVDDFGHQFQLSVISTVEVEPDRLLRYVEKAVIGLLDMVANEREQEISNLTILPDAERDLILNHFGKVEAVSPRYNLVHHYFEEWAEKTPGQIAVQHKNLSLSYGELNRLADELASKLIDAGVKPDDRVVVSFNRGLELVVAILAVLKAGCAYVPVDPDYPVDRQEFMLRDCEPAAIITHRSVTSLHQSAMQAVIFLDAEEVEFGIQIGQSAANASIAAGPSASSLAYVIYTSGSTGIPKGVMIEHQNLCHLVSTARHKFSFSRYDNWALFHSTAFDFSVWEMWGALANGARLTIVPLETARSAEDFNAFARQHQLTVLNHTPSEFRHLFAAAGASEKLSTLRYIFLGAESLDQSCYSDWISKQGIHQNQVVNLYGPTEATVCVTAQASDKKYRDIIPIGSPLPNCEIYILDENGEPVPIGVAGEIHIGGQQLARGYLNRPELTGEKFIANPFSTVAGARLYRTGDVARWRADGGIDYLGRNDFQVKIRGFRIELGEIEAKLSACDFIAEALVMAKEGVNGEKQLIAYYVPTEGVEISAAQIKQQLAHSLVDYMLPAAYVKLTAMPLTPNGKIDRKALPLPDESHFIRSAFVAPKGEVECALSKIWQRLLGLEKIGRHDNFFEIGGHSLLAAKLMNAVKHEFNLPVPLKLIFEHPTVAELALVIETLRRHGRDGEELLSEMEEGEL